VDLVAHKFVGALKELSGKDNNGSGTVTDFAILNLGKFAKDLGGGVSHLNLLKNSGAIIGDDNITDLIDEHFIETLGSERGLNNVGKSGDGLD
jgi:hypothetical protein